MMASCLALTLLPLVDACLEFPGLFQSHCVKTSAIKLADTVQHTHHCLVGSTWTALTKFAADPGMTRRPDVDNYCSYSTFCWSLLGPSHEGR